MPLAIYIDYALVVSSFNAICFVFAVGFSSYLETCGSNKKVNSERVQGKYGVMI